MYNTVFVSSTNFLIFLIQKFFMTQISKCSSMTFVYVVSMLISIDIGGHFTHPFPGSIARRINGLPLKSKKFAVNKTKMSGRRGLGRRQ